jgi:hypothetical protein
MQHAGSLPCSQQPGTGPYPKPDGSNPHPPDLFSEDRFQYYTPTYTSVFPVALLFRLLNQNFVLISHLPHARYMPRLSNLPWFDDPNNRLFGGLQIMELLNV